MFGCWRLAFMYIVGSRERPDGVRLGTFEVLLGAYGSLYETGGGARGTSGAAGSVSPAAPVVGGGMCWLCLRRCEEARETPLALVEAATGRAELLGMASDEEVGGACVGCASTGRR